MTRLSLRELLVCRPAAVEAWIGKLQQRHGRVAAAAVP